MSNRQLSLATRTAINNAVLGGNYNNYGWLVRTLTSPQAVDVALSAAKELGKRAPDAINAIKQYYYNSLTSAQTPSAPSQRTIAPTSMDRRVTYSAPKFVQTSPGRTRLRHREYVGDVFTGSNTGLNSISLEIQPGCGAIFPWLAGQARSWEKYHFKRLKFVFQSTVGTTTSGSFFMAVDPDVHDDAPASKQEFMSITGAVRCNLWNEICMDVPQSILNKRKTHKVRKGPNEIPLIGSVIDLELYDCGRFHYGVSGQPSELNSSAVGELYVEYDVELITATADLDHGVVCSYDHTANDFVVNPQGYEDIQLVQAPTDDRWDLIAQEQGTWLVAVLNTTGVGTPNLQVVSQSGIEDPVITTQVAEQSFGMYSVQMMPGAIVNLTANTFNTRVWVSPFSRRLVEQIRDTA